MCNTGPIPGIAVTTWDTLANGYSFEFTRNWIKDQYRLYQTPKPDEPSILKPEDKKVAPFYNWRFWGNPNASPF